ncbi:magnesium transporter MgtE N-terminal domain-containing protein [Sporomusa acidovorans]|uniref:CBS domain-containing protein n=1 Tax=Sporomusa acidovorans (strain ATCC 49682 / DSM 3132 / Mol) TaxID=1123286 RepID=A0ABZ3IX31_SPOA4|nr:CBS domain-containing protein [Sporomusa acidovorans]OZC23637.1 magnesium transporter MgtE [Sporomusa acidovorans DSM 3132]SDE23489.1 Mg2+ transporter (mgtE) [Sporomusa acidovorans]
MTVMINEFYFSQLLGKPILDIAGRRIGQVKDMAVKWDGAAPRVTGIKYGRNIQGLVPIQFVAEVSDRQVKLAGEFSPQVMMPLYEDEIYVRKWLLDKQIIDFKGSKLVRVNDITLTWIVHEQQRNLVLLAVDVGLRGLFRRLGLEFLVKRLAQNFIGWQFIKPLEDRTSSLQLSRDKKQFSQLHPADIADIVEQLDYNSRASFIKNLDTRQAIEALAEMDLDTQIEIITQMDQEQASDLLEDMPPDEAADILGELPDEKSQALLSLMESDDAEEVQELMNYPDATAGALMTTEYIGLSAKLTAEETIEKIRELAPNAETIYYIYVLDDKEMLLGALSLRELILASPQAKLESIMHEKVIYVRHEDSHRKVADIIHKYGLLAVPVVDEQNSMLGIITVDDVLEILIPERGRGDVGSGYIVNRRLWRW